MCDPHAVSLESGPTPGRILQLEVAWRARRALTRRCVLLALAPAAGVGFAAWMLPQSFGPYPGAATLQMVFLGVLCLVSLAMTMALAASAWAREREALGLLRLLRGRSDPGAKPTNATAPLGEGG